MSDPQEAAAARAQLLAWAAELDQNLAMLEDSKAELSGTIAQARTAEEQPGIRALDAEMGYVSPIPDLLDSIESDLRVQQAAMRQSAEKYIAALLEAVRIIDETGEIPDPPDWMTGKAE